jgi:thymidylate synthase
MNIPVLTVKGNTLAEAWEKSLIKLWKHGIPIKTQYDKPEDPPSIDSTMTVIINNPLKDPMIHKDIPGGLEDLQEYTMEVCDGIKDHWVRNPNDPTDKRWEYTYHQRLFKYTNFEVIPEGAQGYNWESANITTRATDQIELVCQKLAKQPYSRQAQAITWKVWEDNSCYDPACLQSIWCRLTENRKEHYVLNTNVRFRSNDAYKAAFQIEAQNLSGTVRSYNLQSKIFPEQAAMISIDRKSVV